MLGGSLMRVIKNYLYNLTYQIFLLIVPLITIPYISRVLGPSGVGINTVTNSLAQYFILFANLGLTTYGQREIAYHRDDKYKTSKTFIEIELLSIITTLISFILYCIVVGQFHKYETYYFAQSFLILATAADISWLFMGMEKFRIIVLRNFVFKIISIVLIFSLVKNKNDLLTYILIISFTTLISNCSLWPYALGYIQKISIKVIELKKHLAPTIALFLPQIAITVYTVLSKLMLGYLSSVQEAGYFDNADKIVRILLTLVTAFTSVMMPHIANAYVKKETHKIRTLLNNGISFSILMAIPMISIINGISDKFVPWFFGTKFTSVAIVLKIEAFAILPIAMASVLGSQYLIPLNKNKEYIYSILFGAGVNILINIPLISLFQARGTAISTIISEYCVTCGQFYFARSKINFLNMFKLILKTSFAGIITFLVVMSESNFFKMSFGTFIIEGVTGILVYVAILLLMKLPEMTDILKQLKKIKEEFL